MKIEETGTRDKKLFGGMYLEYEVYLRGATYVNDIPTGYTEDVIQGTLVPYTRYGYSLDISEKSKRALPMRILKSRCMDSHRKMKYRSYGELDKEAYSSEDYPAHDKTANPPDCVINKGRCQAFLKRIERMSESWYQVVTFKLTEGRPTGEVCAMLNITGEACYSRVNRIRKYLEELLKSGN